MVVDVEGPPRMGRQLNQGPMWAVEGVVPCSRVSQQCFEAQPVFCFCSVWFSLSMTGWVETVCFGRLPLFLREWKCLKQRRCLRRPDDLLVHDLMTEFQNRPGFYCTRASNVLTSNLCCISLRRSQRSHTQPAEGLRKYPGARLDLLTSLQDSTVSN